MFWTARMEIVGQSAGESALCSSSFRDGQLVKRIVVCRMENDTCGRQVFHNYAGVYRKLRLADSGCSENIFTLFRQFRVRSEIGGNLMFACAAAVLPGAIPDPALAGHAAAPGSGAPEGGEPRALVTSCAMPPALVSVWVVMEG